MTTKEPEPVSKETSMATTSAATDSDPDRRQSSEQDRAPAVLNHPRHVLLVEADDGVAALVKTSLNACQVQRVTSGEEALKTLRRQGQFEFVVTGLLLPGLDGIELIRQARHTVSGSSVPILVLTAKSDEETLVAAFNAGADDYMVKPFSLAELRIRVSSIYMRQMRAGDMNPLTRLPGNAVLKREIESCLKKTRNTGVPWGIAYVDLDHFKAFNDARGFDRGDHVIQLVADVLRQFARSSEPGECFVGHVGGDDFIAIVPLNHVEHLCNELFKNFSDAVAPLFSEEELAAGVMTIIDRRGVERQVPLLSISVGVVNTSREGVSDLRTVSHIAAEVKSVAKETPGNHFFIDRRSS